MDNEKKGVGMTDISKEAVDALLQGVTKGRAVQFHPHYCEEAKGAPFSQWDTSHDVSVILSNGEPYRVARFTHADDAAFYQLSRELVPALRTALDEAEARAVKAEAERDAANALLQRLTEWDECWPSKDVQNITHEARAHLGAKP